MNRQNISVTLITQGNHKFYSGTMDIDLIARTCSTNPREDDPQSGFQRKLDETRANAIAEYIRSGGTIPSSIILSAQNEADLIYNSKNKTISFNEIPQSFLILDGQHRVFGFTKLLDEGIKYRVPVVIYSELSTIEEARVFIDINTLQKPVPKELLLDIKKLADRESYDEALLDEIFTYFETAQVSYLLNKLSRIEKQKNKISKVTFYESLKPIIKEFNITSAERLFRIINNYLIAADEVFASQKQELGTLISRATTFKILIAHARAIITMISDSDDDIEKVSEYKKFLSRSIPGSISEITGSKAYLRSVEFLDRKLLRRNITI